MASLTRVPSAAAGPVGPFPPGVDALDYDRLRRRVLWSMPSGLYLLGSRNGDDRNLMTLNWATQVAAEPKLVAVSVEKAARTHHLLLGGGVFAISILARVERSVVRAFVKPATWEGMASSLNGHPVREALTGAPILSSSAAWLDCGVRHTLDCGSHTLFVGEVVAAGEGGPAGAEILRMEDTRMNYGG